ncbi:FtsK/SpoIIIE domain-containing protein [Virgibacillus salexigens]|uniref:FtsK/SpoIIIE domain-containing protein n=1 Tax=Virgibacillus salexigens TaxID=61016 RepID=UPI00190B3F57|nr:FtsK/SpoIIIE domain-containing protein [Virgibacillus salexigens]
MFTILGWSLLTSSILWGSYPAFEYVFLKNKYRKRKLIENLNAAFINGGLFKKIDKYEAYPHLLRFDQKGGCITFVFTIPKGINPDEFEKRLFVFKQHFGQYIDLNITEQRGILKVFPDGLPGKFKYDYPEIHSALKGKIPIVCGQTLDGKIHSFDLTRNPHVLIAGETGSGKSSEIRSILTTLIKHKSPKQLQLILGDLKRSEFHLFKQIEHVEGVFHSADELRPALNKVKREMVKRGNKLDEAAVNSIDQLKERLPYIVVCIDEVVLLKKETDIMDILEEISSIGRSLGVFIILSMQRPDAKLLDGKLKVNLTVRMGFMTADATNSKIIGTPGSEKINTPGRMLLKINSSIQEIQCPWLDNDNARKLLHSYRVQQQKKEPTQENNYSKVLEMFENE